MVWNSERDRRIGSFIVRPSTTIVCLGALLIRPFIESFVWYDDISERLASLSTP